MTREITPEEDRAMKAVGFDDYMIDISNVSDEFYDDFIRLCKLHAKINQLQHKVDCLEEEE